MTYSHTPPDYACPFCRIAQRAYGKGVLTVESDIVLRNDQVTAFIGSHQWPNNHSHVIVIPNEHYENVFDFPPAKAVFLQEAIGLIARMMKKAYACHGVSTRQHNEPDGGQDVWHYHQHVYPRYKNDMLYGTHRQFMAPGERAVHAERLRAVIDEVNKETLNNAVHMDG